MRKRKIKHRMRYDPTIKLGKLKSDNPPKYEKLFELPDSTNETDGEAKSQETMRERKKKGKARKSS